MGETLCIGRFIFFVFLLTTEQNAPLTFIVPLEMCKSEKPWKSRLEGGKEMFDADAIEHLRSGCLKGTITTFPL